MKIIFCGNLYVKIDVDMKKMKIPPPVSSHKFQMNLIEGFLKNRQNVIVVNLPRVRYYPNYPKIFFRKSSYDWNGREMGENIGFINLLGLNYLTQKISFEKTLKKYIRQFPDEKYVLVCFNNYLPINKAMLSVRNQYSNVSVCSVVGDLHGKYGLHVSERYDGLRGKIIYSIEKKQDELTGQSDIFGLLTEQMADVLEIKDKSHVVIEGIYSDKTKKKVTKTSNSYKTIFYAGAIEEEYGILHLLRAFSLVEGDDYRLKLAGGGGAVEDVKKYAARDYRISYLGFLTPEEVEYHQQMATMLINPRTSGKEYVKYSFPSKTMECLASGKLFIGHKLPCIPKDYDQYIQYPKDESDAALARKIVECGEMEEKMALEFGEKAREFIVTNKNPENQCRKLIELFMDKEN